MGGHGWSTDPTALKRARMTNFLLGLRDLDTWAEVYPTGHTNGYKHGDCAPKEARDSYSTTTEIIGGFLAPYNVAH